MEKRFLDNNIDIEHIILPDSDKINPFLKRNHYSEIIKGLEFLKSDGVFLYVHGFLGTGKRQFINYITDFLDKDVIKLEYYCKASTVCDDILLSFIDKIENQTQTKNINLNAKITTLSVKFQQYLNSVKRPIIIILHSMDDILQDNVKLVRDFINQSAQSSNIKVIISTRALIQNVAGDLEVNSKIFLKAFSKEIFKDFLKFNNVECSETTLEDFYKYTRGYYYYTALVIKIIQAMKLSLNDFLRKYVLSEMNFDSYIGATYLNLVPPTIRNFFWFLRTVRHGLSLNALAVFELYDEFSVDYLQTNLMIFQAEDVIYVQDYFLQNIDISIPAKTEIKLHKYIISIYEKELKEPLQTREITISRQALRAEIEYHNTCINNINNGNQETNEQVQIETLPETTISGETKEKSSDTNINNKIAKAEKYAEENNPTSAIEAYLDIINNDTPDSYTLVNIRLALARLYKNIEDYTKAEHYYELAEIYYREHNEVINLNYLYYELTDLYFRNYKNDRAIETIKKVIYSVDTPQSLLVSASTLLGNIFYDTQNSEEAQKYYKKALESLDENTPDELLAELYFKNGLVNDEQGNNNIAFEYYTKCISVGGNNQFKALAYSNLGSCYFDNDNLSDAKDCFEKAYSIEKTNNNYDGIYYTSLYLAKIYQKEGSKQALDYFLEAKQSAEFINENFYIVEATIALGDYYYDNKDLNDKALIEYFKAKKIAKNIAESVDIDKIDKRINDMKLRMNRNIFDEIEKKYE